MGFASGSITFRRFAVVGNQHPSAVDQPMLDRLAEFKLTPGEFGVPEEVEYGWNGGRHILDDKFGFEHNVFAEAMVFALRIDTNKVPGELKKAYQIMEEEAIAAQNPSGFISKNQRKEAREIVRRKIDEDLRSGRFRKSKLIPCLWDLPGQTLYTSASGAGQEKLLEIFERTFNLALAPLSAGALALRMLEPAGRRREYEDSRPTRFVHGPDGESQHPDYPWVAKGPEPKDFFGNEFLLWLWQRSEAQRGQITTDAGTVAVVFEKSLDLECAYGATGKDVLRDAAPTQMPEARDGLRSGKVPRKANLILNAAGNQYSFSFQPEPFVLGSTALPQVEDAETPRVLFEERIALLRELSKSIDSLYDVFLKSRCSSSWETQVATIRRWIQAADKPVAQVA